jgi:hypothetical protein
MAKRTHAFEKDSIGDSALWRQWQERHTPEVVRLLPVTQDDMLFETGPSTPDDRYDREQDRQRYLKGAPEYYSVTQQGSKEACWITRHEQGDDRYKARLESVGYTL